MENVQLSESLGEVSILRNSAFREKYLLLLAHGAGAGLNHSFLNNLAVHLSSLNGTVIRYNFPYMQLGKKFPTSPKPNIETVGRMIDWVSKQYAGIPVFIGGKSYGGRMSSHWIAGHAEPCVRGLVYFGFPLHPPGKVSAGRADHLYEIPIPQLFIQGTNDKLADYPLISEVAGKCRKGTLLPIASADHSFMVPRSSGLTGKAVIAGLVQDANSWILNLL